METEDQLSLALPAARWAEIIGVLFGLAWYEPQRETVGRLAGQLSSQLAERSQLVRQLVHNTAILTNDLGQNQTQPACRALL